MAAATLATMANTVVPAARAAEYDDGLTVKFCDAFKGKKVVLIVISSGMDIAQGLAAGLTRQSQDLGYELSVRDCNWNNDHGAQAISQAISEKPDVLVVQNLDMQAYASLFRRATKEGIKTIQVQVKSTVNTDAYVGVDWYQIAHKNISKLVSVCSPRAGKSGKIAILQGIPNNPNEVYGQTECNLVIDNNRRMFPIRPGSMGKPIFGHHADIVDKSGNKLPAGQEGIVGVRRPDPIMLLRYWDNPEAIAAKFAGDYLLMGDIAHRDEEGYLWYVGRADDVITSGGYRIGPAEIEDCIMPRPERLAGNGLSDFSPL